LHDYPTVRVAVRLWALHQCLSACIAFVLITGLLIGAVMQCAGLRPAPPPRPKMLILRENFKVSIPTGDDPIPAWWGKMHPPPVGFAYNEHYYLVRLPATYVPAPPGFTYDEKWHLVRIRSEGKDGNNE
jgi:hypothetical protein